MDQKIWSINGIELELDISDADGMERYETAFEIMAEEEKTFRKRVNVPHRYAAIVSFSVIFSLIFLVRNRRI